MKTQSLRTRIIVAFMACVGVSVLAFGVLLTIGLQFKTAQAVSHHAVETNRALVQLDQRARNAETALYRYLNSVNADDRQAMDVALGAIGSSTSGGAALISRSKAATALIEKSQGAAVSLLDSSGSLDQSLVTLGELGAKLSDPGIGDAVAHANQAYGLLAVNLGRVTALNDVRAGDTVHDNMQQLTGSLNDLQGQAASTARMKKVAGVLLRDADALSANFDDYRKLMADRRSALNDLKTAFGAVAGELQEQLDKANTSFQAAGASADAASNLMMTDLLVSAPAVLVIGMVLALAIGRSITRPIIALTQTMGRLADGDYGAEISGQARKDELGAMARAVDVFKANGLSLIDKEREALETRNLADAERSRSEAARAVAAQEQAVVVTSIGSGLSRLAEGDLTVRLSEAFPGEYRKLQSDFNAALGKLQETMGTVVTATAGLRAGAGEISHAADDLSRRTEQTATSLEQTAAALDQITATVKKTAVGAGHAREVVATTRGDAEQSGRVVQDAVVAMGAIEQSAQKISQIIGVIDEIAFQTNLLALNAGVEAARAGDAGRGFAVVASEVRALAQRSAEAAREIKALISTSTSQVDQGVVLVNKAGDALSRIAAQVLDISAVIAEIAASAHEQATGLQEVNTAVNQMDQVTQQNAAMVEETTAASHSLAGEAEQLAALIAYFQVGDDAATTPDAGMPRRRA
jgi:methyl-accepting chemotaxis protein